MTLGAGHSKRHLLEHVHLTCELPESRWEIWQMAVWP